MSDTPSSATGGQPPATHDASRPRIELKRIGQAHLRDYAIRFVFGGMISVIAALIAQWTTGRFGGIFTAFPAILLASLTLIGKHDGNEPSAEDAEGGVAGAIALVLTAAFIAATVTHIAGAASLVAALAVWLFVAVALYALAVKVGWLRTTEPNQQQDGKQQGGHGRSSGG